MSNELSGSSGTGILAKRVISTFSKEIDFSSGLSGYNRITDTSATNVVSLHNMRPKEASSFGDARAQARRYAIAEYLKEAVKDAKLMESAAEAGDLMELSIAGNKLRSTLNDLWEARKDREDDWGDLVNTLQIVIAQKEFERYLPEQCKALQLIIERHLGGGRTDTDDLKSSIRLLRKAGVDPWIGIAKMSDGNGDTDE